jgi:uncharacterized protein (DUF1501 family)
MKRREFLATAAAATIAAFVPRVSLATAKGYGNLLIVVELKGGNDGLNTVVPYADAAYYSLRPQLAIARDQVLQLDERLGLHPSLSPLMPLWEAREVAVVQGVGYPSPNLSHFRSIEIWDTASKSNEHLPSGWLARAFVQAPAPRDFAADGIVIGNGAGPLEGTGTRTITFADPEQFRRQAQFATMADRASNKALDHILRVERNIAQAASGLDASHTFRSEFPRTPFGNAVRTAAQVASGRSGVAAIKVSLGGFDTHRNQQPVHTRLLKDLAESLAALKAALMELGRWKSTLVMTYAEFGRRPRENQSGGTDHGTGSVHLALGGAVRGGLYGAPPVLGRLDGNGNLPFAVDFRDVYATVLERWWGIPAAGVLNGRFPSLDFLA